jgi:DNA-directed RNA polymerase sigma subunit (sigma70/sigma32)
MASYLWLTDEGWPYPDPAGGSAVEVPDLANEIDDDLVSLRANTHLLDDLDPAERTVIGARFGLGGAPLRSMKELHDDMGLTRHQVRDALESGLEKLRAQLR